MNSSTVALLKRTLSETGARLSLRVSAIRMSSNQAPGRCIVPDITKSKPRRCRTRGDVAPCPVRASLEPGARRGRKLAYAGQPEQHALGLVRVAVQHRT